MSAWAHLREGLHPIAPHEYEEVTAVWEASVLATHDFLPPDFCEKLRPRMTTEFLVGPELWSARDKAGRIVGFIGISGDELDMLFIHPDWRGKGIGRRLAEFAIHERGVTKVDVNEQNGQALGFYERLGFETVSRSETDPLGNPFPILHMRLAKML